MPQTKKTSGGGSIEVVGTSPAKGEDFYSLLTLPRSAGEAEIREAYVQALDRAGDDNPLVAQLNRAFMTLRDSGNRKRYDAWLDKSAETRLPLEQLDAPAGSHYALLKVHRKADSREIKRAWRELIAKCHPDAGGSNELAAKVNHAFEVLSDNETRRRYDAELDRTQTPRFRIDGFKDKIPVWTGDLRLAFRYTARTGLTVTDTRQGEPGGLDDVSVLSRYKVTIPPGRRHAGVDRIDSQGRKWVKGVLFVMMPDDVVEFHRLGYMVEDPGPFDPGGSLGAEDKNWRMPAGGVILEKN